MIKKSMYVLMFGFLCGFGGKAEAGIYNESHFVIDDNSISKFSLLFPIYNLYKNATELTINYNYDKYISVLSRGFSNVTKITFAECTLNDEIVTFFAEQAKGTWDEGEFGCLIDLNVSNKNISDIGARAIAENLKTLVALNLEGNPITYEGALELITNLPNLKYFSFDIHNVGSEAQNILKARMLEKGIGEYSAMDYEHVME